MVWEAMTLLSAALVSYVHSDLSLASASKSLVYNLLLSVCGVR